MDLIEQLQNLSAKVKKQKDLIQTEEATKNAFVMPFINSLGYDVFNPLEVMPEFTADVGTKQGEKVDYALFKDGQVIMLIECKKCGEDLSNGHASQLYRYFSVVHARIAVLTNGILYRFYTDLEETNKMDAKPFMEFDMLNVQEATVNELKRFTKPVFDLEETLIAAGDLKYTKEIRRIMAEQMECPSEDFVRFFLSQVYTGRLTQSVREQFTDIVKRALHQFLNEQINDRLKSALTKEGASEESINEGEEDLTPDEIDNRIVTTAEELEGYFIVKSIVRQVVDPERVIHRDTISYMGILLDDNNRKPICRLHFNRAQKYLGLFDENKNEERIPIDKLNDIYNYGDKLKETVLWYEKPLQVEESHSVEQAA